MPSIDPSSSLSDFDFLDNMMMITRQPGISAASHYSFRPPEPPHILIPTTMASKDKVPMAPDVNAHGGEGDETADAYLRVITQEQFIPVDNSSHWKYEYRRNAQKILPFLYLGPWEVIRTQQSFVRSQGISMLLVVRDKATAKAGIMSPKRYAEQLGILHASIDVQDNQELITAFPHAIKLINDHLVACYQQQVEAAGPNFAQAQASFRMGKVYVFCESGNERSAAVVTAYILSMYNVDLIKAIQLVQAQRFCACLNEEAKNLLKSYEDILLAQRHVNQARRQNAMTSAHLAQAPLQPNLQVANQNGAASINFRGGGMKRGRADDDDDEMMDADSERFEGRSSFQPFIQG